MKTVAILAIFGLAVVSAVEIPSFFKICKQSEPNFSECVGDAATNAIRGLAGGLKSFKLMPLEPLAVDSVKIGETEGSVRLRQEYHNIKLYGLTTGLKMTNYKVDLDKCMITTLSSNPQVDFVADYKANGQILLLPIKGSGKSNITMFDMTTDNKLICEKYQKNGQTFLKIKKYEVKFHPKRVTMHFDNLFGGDGMLGAQMNQFIDENADLLFKELQGPYEESFGLVFAQLANAIFSRLPIEVLFPK